MITEFAVSEQTSELINVRFGEDYEKESADRFRERQTSTSYVGP